MPNPIKHATAELLRSVMPPNRAWVLFANGTFVVFTQPTADMKTLASEILREWGPVHAGSPAGDFAVAKPRDAPGWVVTCHHTNVLTYVAPGEVAEGVPDVQIGLYGRRKRDEDARHLEIVHEEPWNGDSA